MKAQIQGQVLGVRSKTSEKNGKVYHSMDVYDSETGRVIDVSLKPEAVAACSSLKGKMGVCLASIFVYNDKTTRFNYLSFAAA